MKEDAINIIDLGDGLKAVRSTNAKFTERGLMVESFGKLDGRLLYVVFPDNHHKKHFEDWTRCEEFESLTAVFLWIMGGYR